MKKYCFLLTLVVIILAVGFIRGWIVLDTDRFNDDMHQVAGKIMRTDGNSHEPAPEPAK